MDGSSIIGTLVVPFKSSGSWFAVWLCLAGALVLDRAWGEMPPMIHPVVYMGKPIRWFKNWGLKKAGSEAIWIFGVPKVSWIQGLGGLAFVAFLPLGVAWLSGVILLAARGWSGVELILSVFLLKATFASKALGDAGMRVKGALEANNEAGGLMHARYALRSLCSRDASVLDESQVAGATVASLAENLSDSVVAPVFFYLVAGIPGAVFYRVINTMDAVLGYRGPLEYLGKAAARCDDLLNLIPARLTALCLVLATSPIHWRRIGRLVWQESGKTPSPNGGWPMAAMAGALEISLVKVGVYRLGDYSQPPCHQHIGDAWGIAQRALWIFLGLALMGSWILMH